MCRCYQPPGHLGDSGEVGLANARPWPQTCPDEPLIRRMSIYGSTMTWNQILIFSTLLIFAPTSLLRAEEKRDCANAMTQVDMNQCAHTDFEEADKELNVIWEAARERARKLDEQHAEMKGA